MPAHRKTVNACLALPTLALLLLAGCSSAAQTRDEIPDWDWGHTRASSDARAALMTSSGGTGAVIFAPGVESHGSWYAYERDLAPEYARRDGELSLRVPDAMAGWYAWPEQARPSLDDRGSFTTSRNANVYAYPGSGRSRSGRDARWRSDRRWLGDGRGRLQHVR